MKYGQRISFIFNFLLQSTALPTGATHTLVAFIAALNLELLSLL